MRFTSEERVEAPAEWVFARLSDARRWRRRRGGGARR